MYDSPVVNPSFRMAEAARRRNHAIAILCRGSITLLVGVVLVVGFYLLTYNPPYENGVMTFGEVRGYHALVLSAPPDMELFSSCRVYVEGGHIPGATRSVVGVVVYENADTPTTWQKIRGMARRQREAKYEMVLAGPLESARVAFVVQKDPAYRERQVAHPCQFYR